jgi:hypothetical protein
MLKCRMNFQVSDDLLRPICGVTENKVKLKIGQHEIRIAKFSLLEGLRVNRIASLKGNTFNSVT